MILARPERSSLCALFASEGSSCYNYNLFDSFALGLLPYVRMQAEMAVFLRSALEACGRESQLNEEQTLRLLRAKMELKL